MKRIIFLVFVSILLFGVFTASMAKNTTSDSSIQIKENVYAHSLQNDDNIETRGGLLGAIVYLSMKASHRNYHTSYTRIVIRQGKKHKITYVAYPRKKCIYCKYLSY